jgi:TM2 domain-containing membrane protein YozV
MFGSIGAPEVIIIAVLGLLAWLVFGRRGSVQGSGSSSQPSVAAPAANAAVIDPVTGLKKCPYCAEDIQAAAIVCKHCGRSLTASVASNVVVVQQVTPNRGVAAVLSLIIPGAGQIYKGQVLRGLIWLVAVVTGYAMFVLPGLILHVCCIVGASMPSQPAS